MEGRCAAEGPSSARVSSNIWEGGNHASSAERHGKMPSDEDGARYSGDGWLWLYWWPSNTRAAMTELALVPSDARSKRRTLTGRTTAEVLGFR